MSSRLPDTVQSTDGVTLKLYDLGGTGPPLLLCHATGFCGMVWEPMAETLREAFHCITFDFRAHGRSTPPVGRSMVWDGMAEDVLAVADAVTPGQPIAAVGHSMGGASLLLAEGLRPGILAKAWTFEPILFDAATGDGPVGQPTAEPSEISAGARRRRDTFADRDEVFERYAAKPPLSMLDPRALRAYVDHGFRDQDDGTVTLRCRPEHEASVFDHHNSGARSVIGSLTVPFAAAASGDGGPPAERVIAAAAEFPNLELVSYENLSHFGPLQDPDTVGRDVREWMLAAG